MNIRSAPSRLPKGYFYFVGAYKTRIKSLAIREHRRTGLSLIVAAADVSWLKILIV